MTPLETESRLDDPDGAYRLLIDAHRGLTDEESAALNTRLVLILANQVGDLPLAEEYSGRRRNRPPRREAARERSSRLRAPNLRLARRESFPHA